MPRASVLAISCIALVAALFGFSGCQEQMPLSPAAIALSKDGKSLWIACTTGKRIVALDAQGVLRWSTSLSGEATGIALSGDGRELAVTCGMAPSSLWLLDATTGSIKARHEVGHSVLAPVFSRDGSSIFVCDRFRDQVLRVESSSGRIAQTIPAMRKPTAAALTPDGKSLVVANHLHAVEGGSERAAAHVTVIDVSQGKVLRQIELANGAGLLQGVAISPDGAWAAVTHNLARFKLPTTQVERGWICSAAVALLDLRVDTPLPRTVLLDNVDAGAANPWAVAWSEDGAKLLVTHAGTHELSVIDYRALAGKLDRRDADLGKQDRANEPDAATDLSFLLDVRRRVHLKGNGPRALAVQGGVAWVAGYFSDTLERVDLNAAQPAATTVWSAPNPVPATPERRGEMAFNDAKFCFQGWLSCSSCHSSTGRVDALNWDLLNDGLGNPKNAKSLLYSHRTPPAMSTGVRDSAEVAVRAGFRHIQFTEPPAGVAESVDAYLKSLEAIPSPHLIGGGLSESAARGKVLFSDPKVGCASCHSGAYYTDLNSYDVGTAGRYDPRGTELDTPTLREVWRTSPYLHDGSVTTMREVLTTRNVGDRHGRTSHLTATQIDDLAAYVLSL